MIACFVLQASNLRFVAAKGLQRHQGQWGLLGGSGKTGKAGRDDTRGKASKLASLAISNRRVVGKGSSSRHAVGKSELNSVARLASLSSSSESKTPPTPEFDQGKIANLAMTGENVPRLAQIEALELQSSDDAPDPGCALLAEPSIVAESLFGVFVSPQHLSALLGSFTNLCSTVLKHNHNPFASASPDDKVQTAQKVSTSKSLKSQSNPTAGVIPKTNATPKDFASTPRREGDISSLSEEVGSITIEEPPTTNPAPDDTADVSGSKRRTYDEIESLLHNRIETLSFVIIGNSYL